MNRRELFASLTGLGALIGLPVKVKAIEKEPKPLCLVFTMSKDMADPSDEEIARMKERIGNKLGPDGPPIIFCGPGCDLKPIYREVPDVKEQVIEAIEEMGVPCACR